MLLAFIGVTALDVASPAANAADASRFDPGLIISDSVFYDFGTMKVSDIQRFLESKVPTCKAKAGDPTCLRNYVDDELDKPGEDGKSITQKALDVVSSGEIEFVPGNWVNTYNQWLNNIQDWCISRQLWWGHQIPAWHDADGNIYVGRTEHEVRMKHRIASALKRDLYSSHIALT